MQSLLLEFVPEGVQFLPLRLQTSDGMNEYSGFAILNILNTIPLINAESVARQYDLFKVPYPPGEYHVTKPLQHEIISARIRGVEFQ